MSRLTDVQVDWVSFVDRAAMRDPTDKSQPLRFLLFKRDDAETNDQGGQMPTGTEDQTLEKAQEEVTDLQTQLEASQAATKAEKERADKAEAEKAAKKPDDDDGESESAKKSEIDKADLSPEVRAYIEKQEAKAEEASKEAKEASEIAKAERDARLTREYIGKAEGYKNLGQEPVQLGPLLKSASEKLTKDEYEQFEAILKAADTQVGEGKLYDEVGRSVDIGKGAGKDGPLDKLEKAASEIRKADPSISMHDAMGRVARENPEWQEQYLGEMRGQ